MTDTVHEDICTFVGMTCLILPTIYVSAKGFN